MCWCNGNGGTLQPLGWRFESPRTKAERHTLRAVCAHKWRRRKNGDSEGRFVLVSDDDEDGAGFDDEEGKM